MKWDFKNRSDRQYKWEAYRSPQDPDVDKVWTWLWGTFGQIGDVWESHDGWLRLRGDEELLIFKLRWAGTRNGI